MDFVEIVEKGYKVRDVFRLLKKGSSTYKLLLSHLLYLFVALILYCVFSNCYQAQIKLGQSIYHTLNRASDPCRPGSVTHCKEKCRCFQLLKRNPIWQVLKRNQFLQEKSTFDNKSKWSPLWWRSGHLIQVENDHGERQHHLQVALCMWVHIVKSSSPSSSSSSTSPSSSPSPQKMAKQKQNIFWVFISHKSPHWSSQPRKVRVFAC